MNAAVFLDRDNTIIHNDGDLGDPEQVVLIKGAATAIASLCGLGYKVIVVTNQGGVARGKYGEEDVEKVHARLAELVEQSANGAKIHGFYYCPYHPQGKVAKYKKEHPTRKPQPGMLLQAAEEHGLDLGQSWMVGDALRDCQAGAAAGCRTILVREDADRLSPLDMAGQPGAASEASGGGEPAVKPDFMAATLVDAVRIIAQQRKPDAAGEAQRPRKWDASAVARLQRAPRPAEEPSSGEVGDSRPSRGGRPPARPFRPWNAPDADIDPARRAEPRASRRGRPSSAPEPAPEPTDADAAPAPEPDAAPDRSAPQTRPQQQPRASPQPASPKVTAPPAPARGDAGPDIASDAIPSGSYKTLRLILQELRAMRGEAAHQHSAPMRTFALVLQIIAVLCLLGALWMGAANDALFIRWWATAIFVQMSVLVALMFGRRGG